MSHRLIITADDYGMCEPVNEAIEACLAAGAMRSTCVMTNMPCYQTAGQLRERFPGISLGLHWTLTTGRPALPATRVPDLVGPEGEFLEFGELRKRFLAGRVSLGQIKAELTAQFARFHQVAGRPDYWNSHQNVHVTPGLFHPVVDLARQLGIPMMRSHRRITVPRAGSAATYSLRHPLYWLKGELIKRWAASAEARGMRMPDGIVFAPGFGAGKAAIETMLPLLQWGGVRQAAELVIHPATRVEEKMFGDLTESRLSEYKVFSDPGLKSRLAAAGVETVGFEVLNGR